MSHKTEVKTTLNNKGYLKRALERKGFIVEEAPEGQMLTTKGNYGVHENVDMLVKGNGAVNYNDAVGFKKNEDGTYTAVGDFYGLRTQDGQSLSANILKGEITAHSKEIQLDDTLQSIGFVNDSNQRRETNEYIEITYTRDFTC